MESWRNILVFPMEIGISISFRRNEFSIKIHWKLCGNSHVPAEIHGMKPIPAEWLAEFVECYHSTTVHADCYGYCICGIVRYKCILYFRKSYLSLLGYTYEYVKGAGDITHYIPTHPWRIFWLDRLRYVNNWCQHITGTNWPTVFIVLMFERANSTDKGLMCW